MMQKYYFTLEVEIGIIWIKEKWYKPNIITSGVNMMCYLIQPDNPPIRFYPFALVSLAEVPTFLVLLTSTLQLDYILGVLPAYERLPLSR